MSKQPSVPGFGKNNTDYGEREANPPTHHHVGPWAVFQAYEPSRYTEEDRAQASLAMRFLSMDPGSSRVTMVNIGRRALDAVLAARLRGETLDDVALFLRVMNARVASAQGETMRGHR